MGHTLVSVNVLVNTTVGRWPPTVCPVVRSMLKLVPFLYGLELALAPILGAC